MPRYSRSAPLAVLLLAVLLNRAGAQEAPAPETPAEQQSPAPSPPAHTFLEAIRGEARRYATDSVAFFSAPLQWNSTDWKRAAGFTVILGGLFALDRRIDRATQANRSGFTNGISGATTTFGSVGAFGVSGALLAGGLVFQEANTRDMGREAVEASVISGLLTNLVLKPAFGRERPGVSNGRTDFKPLSKNASFPSGHATEAFSVASVVAMRAHGWVVPALAYTAATLVAFDRLNSRAHFSSDVFAGAVLGTVTGRYLVARHRREEDGSRSGIRLDIRPMSHGLSAHLMF